VELQSYNSVGVLAFVADSSYPRLTRQLLDELETLLAGIARERTFRGVVLAANFQSFATGADIEEIAGLQGLQAREFARRGQRLMNSMRAFPLPLVAAIRGFCLGGGLDLALACHARVAAYQSSFGHPGGALGLITGWGGTQRLPRLVGKPAAFQMLLTGERIPATQALTLGLVDELASSQDLIARAVERAERAVAQQEIVPGFLA
jgi:enoyl-CoA hydratase